MLEVWRFNDGTSDDRLESDQLVGVCMVPLQQLYLTFKDRDRTALALNSSMPLMVSGGDWLPVNDLVTGAEMGQVKVTLAVGTEKQLYRMENKNSGKTKPNEGDEESEEHLYDTVGEEEEEGDEELQQQQQQQRHQQQQQQVTQTPGTESPTRAPASLQPAPTVGPAKRTATATIGNTATPVFVAQVKIEEARKLPRVFDPCKQCKVEPTTFVTFSDR